VKKGDPSTCLVLGEIVWFHHSTDRKEALKCPTLKYNIWNCLPYVRQTWNRSWSM